MNKFIHIDYTHADFIYIYVYNSDFMIFYLVQDQQIRLPRWDVCLHSKANVGYCQSMLILHLRNVLGP